MPSTSRASTRVPADFYPTPAWCVRRLVEAVEFPAGEWLEPAAGDGAIIRTISRVDVSWTAWELRESERCALTSLVPEDRVHIGDFLVAHAARRLEERRYAVAITNPPYRHAQRFLEGCLVHAETVAMLLRLNYLASRARYRFMRDNVPDVYVLPSRPSFVNGRTDATEYAWFVWSSSRGRRASQLRILGLKHDGE